MSVFIPDLLAAAEWCETYQKSGDDPFGVSVFRVAAWLRKEAEKRAEQARNQRISKIMKD